jgi:hypothetical protein
MNKRDGILVIVLLVIAGVVFLVCYGRKSENGNQVVITADGTVYGTYRFDQDQEIEIKTEHGTNTVVIEDGRVYMKSADCPDEYCVKQGAISHSKENIICLPHKLVVEVESVQTESEEKEIDAIVQ